MDGSVQGWSSRLTVDLGALAANYRAVVALAKPARVGAVVKADAYGLGAEAVAETLAGLGCADFFVASLDEAVALRAGPLPSDATRLYVLNGLAGEPASALRAARVVPVLNTPDDVALWKGQARAEGQDLAAALHVDTGINRLGLALAEGQALLANLQGLEGMRPLLLMSHLACADEPDHPLNAIQRDRFARLRRLRPDVAASLANSAGTLLGKNYLHDLVRPGIALYGGAPSALSTKRFRPVVRLEAPILQVRRVDKGESVGYAASHTLGAPARIATIAAGYADGYMRALGNGGEVVIGGYRAPVVGRVSMDLVTLDVSALPEEVARPGTMVELIGPDAGLDSVAARAQTLSYEMLTRIGARARRHYVDAARATPSTRA